MQEVLKLSGRLIALPRSFLVQSLISPGREEGRRGPSLKPWRVAASVVSSELARPFDSVESCCISLFTFHCVQTVCPPPPHVLFPSGYTPNQRVADLMSARSIELGTDPSSWNVLRQIPRTHTHTNTTCGENTLSLHPAESLVASLTPAR